MASNDVHVISGFMFSLSKNIITMFGLQNAKEDVMSNNCQGYLNRNIRAVGLFAMLAMFIFSINSVEASWFKKKSIEVKNAENKVEVTQNKLKKMLKVQKTLKKEIEHLNTHIIGDKKTLANYYAKLNKASAKRKVAYTKKIAKLEGDVTTEQLKLVELKQKRQQVDAQVNIAKRECSNAKLSCTRAIKLDADRAKQKKLLAKKKKKAPKKKKVVKAKTTPKKKVVKTTPKKKAVKTTPKPVKKTQSFQRVGEPIYSIKAIALIGDRKQVQSLKGWDEFEKSVIANKISEQDVDNIQKYIIKKLRNDGYLCANVVIDRSGLDAGFLAYRIGIGEVGSITVVGNKFYRTEQILKNIDLRAGKNFNYTDLYTGIFALNNNPDLVINSKLKPRRNSKGDTVVDLEMTVKDTLPLHGSINLSNTGSEATSDWRTRLTLQYLNLTKHDDVISLQWLTDPNETQNVQSFSTSYYLPFGNNWSLSLYGGWSESDLDDVLPELDVYGQGYFGGIRMSKILYSDRKRSIDMSFGWLFQHTENATDLAGVAFDKKEVDLSMPTFTIGYSDKIFDRFGGRNFISNTLMYNSAGNLGSSPEDDFLRNYAKADGNIFIDKLSLARYQKLFGNWTLLAKMNGQYSSDVLIPALQMSLGGANSVRGYREREVSADSGLTASLELSTPLFFKNVIPGLKRSKTYLKNHPGDWKDHKLRLVTFVDYGYLRRNEPEPGLQGNEVFTSAGLGLRLNLTKYFQMKFDYGFPFEKTEESDGNGRGHLSLQLQF